MSISAVIVAYQTNPTRLDAILRALTGQCAVVLADNSEEPTSLAAIRQCVERYGGTYIPMGGNLGIGAAQNTAIAAAWDRGADSVLLLDDDSIPAPDLVAVLVSCRSPVPGEQAVFCASAMDATGKNVSNVNRGGGMLTRCREMMSSGSLIDRSTFERVGPFDEKLFIDGVDFDWGWRAQSKGIGIYVTHDTSITHRLGEGEIAGVRVPSPLRHYYQFRNVLRLMTRRHTPWAWRITQALKLPIKLVLITLLMPQRMKRLQYSAVGVVDAVRGRFGKLHQPQHPRDTKSA